MKFTYRQYSEAIESLQMGRLQLVPDGKNCNICTDSDHQAFECGQNPLVAMALCASVAKHAQERHEDMHRKMGPDDKPSELHEFLHYLAGYDNHMGLVKGPARIVFLKHKDIEPTDENKS